MLGWLIAGIIGAIIIGALAYSTVTDWFREHNTYQDDELVNRLLRQKIASGKHRVIAGVFNKETNEFEEKTAWETDEIDDELKSLKRDTWYTVTLND